MPGTNNNCRQCGSTHTTTKDGIIHCHSCGSNERVDSFRTCPCCGAPLRMRSSTRGDGWRLQMSFCTECDHRQIVESRVLRTARGRFKRGQGLDAEAKKRS